MAISAVKTPVHELLIERHCKVDSCANILQEPIYGPGVQHSGGTVQLGPGVASSNPPQGGSLVVAMGEEGPLLFIPTSRVLQVK